MIKFKYYWITVFVVLLDQATKLRVRHTMELWESFSVWGDFFRINYVTNYGGAFSLSIGDASLNRVFFMVATLIAMFLLVILILKTDKLMPAIAYWMILGGAIGNLIDRIAYGYVIDFLDFDFFDFIISRWPVFNIADSAVTIGVIILVIDLIFFSPPDNQPRSIKTQGI